MEYQGEKWKENNTSQSKSKPKRKAQSELTEKEEIGEREKMDNITMEIDTSIGEELSSDEEVLRKLLNEWRQSDEWIIQSEKKWLYRETFQQYQAKQRQGKMEMAKHLGLQ